MTITYHLQQWGGNGHESSGTFTTTTADLGIMWRRYPSNGRTDSYLIAKEYPDAPNGTFSGFVLTKTNLEEFSIAPHTITNGLPRPTINFGRFDADGVYRQNSGLYNHLIEKIFGSQIARR